MPRFFLSNLNLSGDKIIVTDYSQVHHIRDVLRLKLKEAVTIVDAQGNEYNCLVEEIFPESVGLKIKNQKAFVAAEKINIAIACAIAKNAKMDDIVDKLTQLGVDRIIPLLTERVIVKLDKKQEIARHKRWEKIALSASQQSQRNRLPIVEPIKHIKEVLADLRGYDLKLIPTLGGDRRDLKSIFLKTTPKNILALIGPEGDFTEGEIELAIKSGCIPVSLGDLVLRVDTAAIAVCSFIRFYCDQ